MLRLRRPMSWLPGDVLSSPSFPRSAWDTAARTGDSRGANLETPRAQALALLGAFENYRTLMAQLSKEYETASNL